MAKFLRRAESKGRLFSPRELLKSEHGASLVEFSVSAGVLLGVMFAMIQISQALYAYSATATVARQATRYAIVRGSSCTGFPSNCPVTGAELQTWVQNIQYPGVNGANFIVTPSWSAFPTGGSCTPSTSCNNPGNLVKVTVQYQFALNLPFLKSMTMPLQSSSEMIISQ